MLAAPCDDIDKLQYPLIASPKIDGIRCLIVDGVATSRSLKPIPNRYIQSVIGRHDLDGCDGELTSGTNFNDSSSGIMSEDGEPDFMFRVFDLWNLDLPYSSRLVILDLKDKKARVPSVCVLPSEYAVDRAQLDLIVARHLNEGYEGTMVRSVNGPYKWNRATFKEGYLTKIKPFEDDEAIIVGFAEQMANNNVATTNALGRTERSSHKENLVGKGTLGALVVSHKKYGEFNLGTGFDDFTRQRIWSNKAAFMHKTVKFRYQKFGTKDKPRIPVFLGFRDERDMSN